MSTLTLLQLLTLVSTVTTTQVALNSTSITATRRDIARLRGMSRPQLQLILTMSTSQVSDSAIPDWAHVEERSLAPYFVIPSVFSDIECKCIIEQLSTYERERGKTWDGEKYSVDEGRRNLDTSYIPRTSEVEWIYHRMDVVFFRAAEAWRFDVRETREDVKFLAYKAGSHFSQWHQDIGDDYSALRKISMSVELCDSKDYNGGDMQVFPTTEGHVAGPDRTAGTAIVFPSFGYHRVTPVVDGVRYAIVNWISGPMMR